MKLRTKIFILVILFSFKGILHFLDVVAGVINGIPFMDYLGAFIDTFAMAFVAYTLYAKREKSVYWLAVFLAGIVLVRFILGIGFTLLSDPSLLPPSLIVLAVINVLLFGVIPLILLFTKELRDSFLHPKAL